MRRLLLVATLLAAGCGSGPAGATSPLAKEVTLAPGQPVSLADGLSVRFVGVSGDSRCPADANCILGGDAIVKVQVTSATDTRDFELHTGNAQPVTSRELTVTLLQLAPYPFSSQTIQPEDYRATVLVTR